MSAAEARIHVARRGAEEEKEEEDIYLTQIHDNHDNSKH